jgi:hypothetical protein
MPYHNIGVEKARRIGREALHVSLKSAEKELSAKWAAQLGYLGCTTVTIG